MIKAGLDIGNNKISCVVADYKGPSDTNLLSIKTTPTINIKKNVIVNYDNLLHQIKTLIEVSDINNKVYKKEFIEKKNYNTMSSKFDLGLYENNTKKDLAVIIARNISIYLNSLN